jgi:hypothetical protein
MYDMDMEGKELELETGFEEAEDKTELADLEELTAVEECLIEVEVLVGGVGVGLILMHLPRRSLTRSRCLVSNVSKINLSALITKRRTRKVEVNTCPTCVEGAEIDGSLSSSHLWACELVCSDSCSSCNKLGAVLPIVSS